MEQSAGKSMFFLFSLEISTLHDRFMMFVIENIVIEAGFLYNLSVLKTNKYSKHKDNKEGKEEAG